MARLTAPNGATVEVDGKRVERLVRYGFTEQKAKSEPKAPAKKAASSKSDSK